MENKMNKISIALSLALVLTFIYGCSEETVKPPEDDVIVEIDGFTKFNYYYLGQAPIHTQTSMLTGYQHRLYRIGSQFPIQVLDLLNNTWSQISMPDSSYWRWDGAAVTISDSIFIVAVRSSFSQYKDIIKLDITTNSFSHTGVNLPSHFSYPAYCVYNDKIIFFSIDADSVFEFDSQNRKLVKVIENPFWFNFGAQMTLASGTYLNYFYVFGGYYRLDKNIFYRLNLDNYKWEKLLVPKILEKKPLLGSTFGSHLFLLGDSLSTYEYSILDNKWYVDTSEVVILPRNLIGEIIFTEWSFFSTDSCLYATEITSNKMWKITK